MFPKLCRPKIADLKGQLDPGNPVWTITRPVEMKSREGTEFEQLDDGSVLAVGPNPAREEYALTFELPGRIVTQSDSLGKPFPIYATMARRDEVAKVLSFCRRFA